MNREFLDPIAIEPERYELFSAPLYRFQVDRRAFIKSLGGGIAILLIGASSEAQESGGRRRGGGGNLPQTINAWVHIGQDGRITAYTGKVEVGQNTRTALTQCVAEELGVPLSAVDMVMGDTDKVPYDAGTFGSRSVPDMVPQIRRASASLRELLIDLAAKQWNVDRRTLKSQDGKIVNTINNETLDFAALTQGQQMAEAISTDVPLVPVEQWTVLGKDALKVNGRDIVTGKHQYASDLRVDGMMYGKVLRPPSSGAKLVSVNTTQAEAMPGVVVVHDNDFVGVAAPDLTTAENALRAIQSEWTPKELPSEKDLFTHLKENGRDGDPSHAAGSIEEGMALAEQKLEQLYTVAYIAHFPLETRAALAQWEGDKLTAWTGTQRPFGVRSELVQAFGVSEQNVRVIMPDTGSGYGGKHTGEAAVEAARLAKAAGKPVKVMWTREEEFKNAYLRPAGVIDIRSGVTNDGKIVAWEFHNYNSGGAAIRPMYDFPNQANYFHGSDSPFRQGSYRSLAAPANHFARETHIDELAHLVGMNPLEFRLANIKDERLRDVLLAAAKAFGWGEKQPEADQGFGLACGFDKNSYVATCAEVAVNKNNKSVKIVRIVEAFDCGPALNPNNLKNQIEGGIVMAIGGAMREEIHFTDGRITNAALSHYDVPRFKDLPPIEVVLLDRKDIPSAGAGETPLCTVAPAIGNAIFSATGVRLRAMPLVPEGLKA